MYINRAKALLLVGTIAAGCTSANDEGPDNPGAAGSAGAGTAGGGTAGAPSAGGSSQGGGGAGTAGAPSAGGSSQRGGGAGTAGTPSAGGSGQSGPDAGDPDSGSADAGDLDPGPDAGGSDQPDAGGDAGGASTCDDAADTLVDCSGLEQTECDGLEGFLSSECEMLEFNMKPATSNRARNCMIALEPPELCDASNTYACILGALASSCPDPEADDECTTIAAACGDSIEFNPCSSALSGMTQSGRDQMVECATESCNLFACIAGLTF